MSSSGTGEDAITVPYGPSRRSPATATERNLIREAKRGSASAVDALVARHWDAAHRAAYLIVRDPEIAEDIAQEAMVATIGALDRFDWRRPLRPYLHRIVVNRALDWLRGRRARPEVGLDEVTARERRAELPESGVSRKLLVAMGSLDPEDRAAIVLRYVLDYRSREVAEFLGVGASTARSRLSRSLDRLRAALDAEGGTPDEL